MVQSLNWSNSCTSCPLTVVFAGVSSMIPFTKGTSCIKSCCAEIATEEKVNDVLLTREFSLQRADVKIVTTEEKRGDRASPWFRV